MNILITGATGFVGKTLVKRLIKEKPDAALYLLVRSVDSAISLFDSDNIHLIEWKSIYDSFDLDVKELDCVINLMGAGIADKRWTNERKKELYNSRVDGTKNLIKILYEKKIKIKNVIQMSAIGIYEQSSSPINENAKLSHDFLGKLCQDWEQAITSQKEMIPNYCILRAGIIIGKNGGAIQKMLPVFSLGLGGKLASGNQYMSWIHLDDLISLILKNLEHSAGAKIYNATSPYTVKNSDFTKVMGDLLRKPTFFSVPKFALKIAAGEVAETILSNHNILPQKLKDEKFIFRYPTLENALKEVVSK